MMQTYFDLLNLIFLFFSILSLGALAGLMAERVGIVNIAIEGQMAIGALMFAVAGMFSLPIITSYIVAIGSGILISLLLGFATIRMKAHHIISGLAINLLVAGIAPFVIKVLSQGRGYLLTGFKQARLAVSGPLSMFNVYVIVAILALIKVWYLINKTYYGLVFVATGENPKCLAAAGINPNKQRWIGLVFSGIFAGLAGAFYTTFISNLFRGSVYGVGFMSLAVLIFGQWRVKSITIAAFIFALFAAMAQYDLPILSFIPRSFQIALPYVISLIALILLSKTTKIPKAIGKKLD